MSHPSADVPDPLAAVLARYDARVRRLAARFGLAGNDVEELLQEVRIRIWRHQPAGGNLDATPASYVYRTAVSAAIDFLRRRRARRETPVRLERPSGEAVLGHAPAADRALEASELAAQIEETVADLLPSRAVVVRLHLAGYAREEIAALLGFSEPRTRHLLYRGLDDLRQRLKARGIGPESTS